MFLLNVLLDLTDELDVFCRSFATQNTSASLYSILTYQIKFPPPHLGYLTFNFPTPPPPPPLASLLLGTQELTNLNIYNFLCSLFLFLTFFTSFVQKPIWHFGVAWLISQYFSRRDLKPVTFLVTFFISYANLKRHFISIWRPMEFCDKAFGLSLRKSRDMWMVSKDNFMQFSRILNPHSASIICNTV